MNLRVPLLVSTAVVTTLCGSVAAASADQLSFNRDIRPILTEHCYACHGPDANHRKADLRLDDRKAAIDAGAIVPGKPEASSIIERIFTSDEDDLMPPTDSHKKLSAAQKEALREWVAQGAGYEKHWAFLPVTPPAVPKVHTPNPIDAFVKERLSREGASLQPAADPRTLLRRVALDLTGLPPTPAEVEAFVSASQAGRGDAVYEAAVNHYLASPAYGENMARMWLDYARYGDSHGYEKDSARVMWPWRDWVIRAFNENKRFDQFTIEQLAGDLLPSPTQDQLIATGFNRNHRINAEGGALAEEWRIENIIDRVDTTSSTWLGLTMGCARCHDHKFDPITQKEFFQMFAFFSSVDELGIVSGSGPSGNQEPKLDLSDSAQKAELARLNAAVKELSERKAKLMGDGKAAKKGKGAAESQPQPDMSEPAEEDEGPGDSKALVKELRKMTQKRDAFANALPSVMIMKEAAKPKPAHLLIRGQYTTPGEVVTPATPSVLPPLPPGPANRLAFARWLTSPEHPLTARVWVNRQWERFFATGLVTSTDNLGVQCDPPSHPELLDWLASEFVRSGWDMKAMQKLIVMSATYRQSSVVKGVPESLRTRDPLNRLLGHAPRLRLTGETLRDQALALSGLLDAEVGGPSVKPYMPPNIWDETSVYGDLRNYKADLENGLYRRTLYTIWKRTAAPPTLLLFDAPSREVCTVRRSSTNTPLQALALLNEVTFVEAARVLGQRMMKEGGDSPEKRLRWAFRHVTQRDPLEHELQRLLASWRADLTEFQKAPQEAAKLLSHGNALVPPGLDGPTLAACTLTANVLLNLDEIITRE